MCIKHFSLFRSLFLCYIRCVYKWLAAVKWFSQKKRISICHQKNFFLLSHSVCVFVSVAAKIKNKVTTATMTSKTITSSLLPIVCALICGICGGVSFSGVHYNFYLSLSLRSIFFVAKRRFWWVLFIYFLGSEVDLFMRQQLHYNLFILFHVGLKEQLNVRLLLLSSLIYILLALSIDCTHFTVLIHSFIEKMIHLLMTAPPAMREMHLQEPPEAFTFHLHANFYKKFCFFRRCVGDKQTIFLTLYRVFVSL